MALLPYGGAPTYSKQGTTRPGLMDYPMGQRPTGGAGYVGGGADYGIWPTYGGYDIEMPSVEWPTYKGAAAAYPSTQKLPTYRATAGQTAPITQLPTYEPTTEAYPTYAGPETGGLTAELQETISARMRGEGTAGAESAIYQRGEARVQEEYEEGLRRIDEEMSARGLTGSGIHGEAVSKLEEERQESLADLSRQVTIYGQQAIESSMGRAQQYVEYQSAEAARELAAKERGYGARVQESILKYESEARAAEAKGASEQAAYNTAIAERIRAYESQARATEAKNAAAVQKWQAKSAEYMQKYQAEMQKAQFLTQAKLNVEQMAQDEYWRVYQSEYQATRDEYLAKQAAEEAARKKKQEEWGRAQYEAEQRAKQPPGPAIMGGKGGTQWPGEVHGPGWEYAFGSTVGGVTGGGAYGGGY